MADHERSSDDALVARARRGDRDALSDLLDRYRDRAVRVAYGVLQSPADAEDAAQEALIRAFRSVHCYRGSGRFFTWLYRIVVNTALNARRTRGSQEIACEWVAPTEASGDPAAIVARRTEVERVMLRLPARQRAVLTLREVEQLSYAEIADVLGISEGSVKSYLAEARRAFRRLWQEGDNDEMQ